MFQHKIQYYETDKMGITHHSNYIRFFEEARGDYLEKNGLGYDKIEELGLIVPVLGVECDFKATSTYNDILTIEPKITFFNGIKFTIEYRITSQEGKLVHCVGQSRHCFLDKNFKPTLIKKTYPKVYDFIMGMLEADGKK